MSNDKNIENFDSFLKDAFNSFEPTAPKGVFEALQSQIGVAGSSGAATGATTAAKAGAWGVGKIIVGAVAAIAVATTVYIAVPSETNTTTNQNTVAQTENATEDLTNPIPSTNNENATVLTNEVNTSSDNNTSSAEQAANENTEYAQIGGTPTNNSQDVQPNDITNNGGDNTPPKQNTGLPLDNNDKVDVDAPKESKTIVGIYLSDKQLCINDRLTVTIADNLSQYKYRVSFGDGSTIITALGKPTTHKYANSGKFKIIAKEISGKKETIEKWVDVKQTVASFAVENTDKATYKFINKSKNAVHYTWFFGDNTSATQEKSPIHTFKNFSPQSYKVKLVAMDNVGCLDSFSTYVKQNYTYEDKKPKMYNVFSPDADGLNDHYEIEISDEEKYHLLILDKSGNKVFESKDKNIKWDGRNMFTGNNCPAANYVVIFSYKIKGFEDRQEKKFVALVR